MKIIPKAGYTLIELIVASALVGVVLLGVISVNMALNSNNQDYSQKYLTKSVTQVVLDHILKNANLAIGNSSNNSAGRSEKGIFIGGTCPGGGDLGCGDPINNPNTFCIHQDILSTSPLDSTVVNTPTTVPPAYINPAGVKSRWLCYTLYTAGANANQIYYCKMPYNFTIAHNGATSCLGNATAQYLGTAKSITYVSGAPNNSPTFSTTLSGLSSTNTFSITIQNCYNDALPTCNGTGVGSGSSSDPAANPEVQLSGSVTPPQEGS